MDDNDEYIQVKKTELTELLEKYVHLKNQLIKLIKENVKLLNLFAIKI